MIENMRKPVRLVLKLLSDGEFHRIDDISRDLNVPVEFVIKVSRFLEKWSFAELNDERRRIRLKPDFLKLPQD